MNERDPAPKISEEHQPKTGHALHPPKKLQTGRTPGDGPRESLGLRGGAGGGRFARVPRLVQPSLSGAWDVSSRY